MFNLPYSAVFTVVNPPAVFETYFENLFIENYEQMFRGYPVIVSESVAQTLQSLCDEFSVSYKCETCDTIESSPDNS